MIELIADRTDIKQSVVLPWDQGGRNKVINDNNCVYALTPAITVQVRHLRWFANRSAASNRLLRIDQVPGGWENGNFDLEGAKLIETDAQSGKDGPIVITFLDTATQVPRGVRAVGANIQSCTLGEFTGVISSMDLNGAIVLKHRLGLSDSTLGAAIFLGVSSDVAEIQRIEFETTNIVEDGHAPFDALGFAINQLSVRP